MNCIKIIKRNIILAGLLITFPLLAQETQDNGLKVTGKVTNKTGATISGAKVSLPGYSTAFTNDSGIFELKIPAKNVTLQVEAKAFQYIEVPLRGDTIVNVQLYEEGFKSDYSKVDLPFGVTSLSNSVYSIGAISGDASWKTTAESPQTYLQGKIAGVNVVSRSGSPGVGSNIYIRGFNSLNRSNQPLIVVDGMIYDNNSYGESLVSGFYQDPLTNIDIKDIESISVIKDALSTYGSKASNGVILIQTKRSVDVATKIDFSAYTGVNFKPVDYPVLGADDYRVYLNEMAQSAGTSLTALQSSAFMTNDKSNEDYYRYHNNTNWQDEVFKTNTTQNYDLRVTGGDNIAKYMLTIGYLNQGGIVKETNYSRYNTRFNADLYLTQKLRLNTNLGFSYGTRTLFDDGISPRTNPVYQSMVKSPLLTPYIMDKSGIATPNLEDADILGVGNPTAILQNGSTENSNHRFFGSANLSYMFSEKLNISVLAGVNNDKVQDNVFIPGEGTLADTTYSAVIERESKRRISTLFSYYTDTKMNYNSIFNSIHSVAAVVGMRYSSSEAKNVWNIARNSDNDKMRSLSSGLGYLSEGGGELDKWNWMSLYAGADYNLNKKYFLSANVSTDGSSRFGTEAKDGISLFSKKFGVYPSVGASWLVSSENFMKSISPISLFKIRVTYGITGNDDVDFYSTAKSYTTQNILNEQGTVLGNLENKKLQWETVRKANAGLDLSLFHERVRIGFDYFRNMTSNMQVLNSPSIFTGLSFYSNDGKMENKGYEIQLNVRVLDSKVKWDVGAGVAHYANKITQLAEDNQISQFAGANILSQVGSSTGLFYGYRTMGIFTSDQEAAAAALKIVNKDGTITAFKGGDVHFVDIDGNGIIDASDRDVIGNPNPKFTGMVSNNLKWNRFELDAVATFSVGGDVFNYQRYVMESMQNYNNQSTSILNRWHTDGQVTDMPRAAYGDPMGNSSFSDRWIENGSYMKLKSITLSYDIPFKPGFFRSASVYATGLNLLTITKYLGRDPEFNLNQSTLCQGIDYGYTPVYKSVLFGIKIGL